MSLEACQRDLNYEVLCVAVCKVLLLDMRLRVERATTSFPFFSPVQLLGSTLGYASTHAKKRHRDNIRSNYFWIAEQCYRYVNVL
jgi:hypothetical protein